MSKRLIRDALLVPLEAIAELPKLIKENSAGFLTSDIDTVITDPFCRTSIVALNRSTQSLGETGVDKWTGVFQIDLFYPPNTGSDGADWMSDRIVAAYPEVTYLDTPDDYKIHILKATPEFSRQNTNEYMSVVTVRWEAYIGR